MEGDLLNFLFTYFKNLQISDCDIYLNRPTLFGEGESRKKSYVVISFPHGIESLDAFQAGEGVITIGSRDHIMGLPNAGEITRISTIIKQHFPILTEDYSCIDFEFSSDDSIGNEWHEYYYTFQQYINH